MKKIFISIVSIFLFNFITLAQVPATAWTKTYGGSGVDISYSIVQTFDSCYIAVGESSSNDGDVTGNHGSSDYWVVKTDTAGNIVWEKSLGGSGIDIARSIEPTTDSCYIIAGYTLSNNGDVTGNQGGYDFWIVKIDNSGNLLWSKTYGGTDDDKAYDVQLTLDGGYIVAGYSASNNGDVSGGHGDNDFWVLKLDNNGDTIWTRTYGGSDSDIARSIELVSDSGYIIAGYSKSNDFDVEINYGGDDFWVLRLNKYGDPLWAKTFGDSEDNRAYSVAETKDRNIIVGGGSFNNDLWAEVGLIVKLKPDSDTIWTKLGFEDSGQFFKIYSILQTTDGGFITASEDWGEFGVIKYDFNGIKKWEKALPFGSRSYEVKNTYNEGYIIAGHDYSDNYNYLVVKLNRPPHISPVPQNQIIGSSSGQTYFVIESNVDWTVTENEDWFGVSPLNGSGNDSLIVTYTENTTGSERVGYIKLGSAVTDTVTITLTQSTTHFSKVWNGNPNQPMVVIIPAANINGQGLQANDEIGIFDDSSGEMVCVGAAVLDGPITPGDPLVVTVAADDPTTPEIDGFIDGSPIIFKIWDQAAQIEYPNVSADYNINFDQVFTNLGTAVVDLTGYAYYQTVWTGNPYQSMNFIVNGAVIDGLALSAGDEIGLFDTDGSGAEFCVGVAVVVGTISPSDPLLIIAGADDPTTPEKDGFTPGNSIWYKIWDASELEECLNVEATYNPGFDSDYTQLGTAVVELQGFNFLNQTISLITGWNTMSFAAILEDSSLINIVQPLIDSSFLVKVIDEAGGFIQQIPVAGWMNTIGYMKNTEGYYIKVSENALFDVTGRPVDLPFDIPLFQGWNIMGYPLMQSQNAMDAMQPLIDNSSLVKVIDEAGGFIQDIPGVGWMNTIGSLNAGKGYYIKVSNSVSLWLDNPSFKMAHVDPLQHAPPSVLFKRPFKNNPYYPMNILISDIDIDVIAVRTGDEIAVYDGERCVGTGVVDLKNDVPVIIVATMDDPTTYDVDGFVAGNNMSFRFMSDGLKKPVALDATDVSGDMVFEPFGTYICSLTADATSIADQNNGAVSMVCIPNPSSGKTTIRYNALQDGELVVEICDLTGNIIRRFQQKHAGIGIQEISFEAGDLQQGIYLIKAALISQDNHSMKVIRFVKN